MRGILRFSLCLLLVGFGSTAAMGDLTTFNVDLSGTTSTGVELRAFGTIDVDPSLPISTSVGSYDLQIQRGSDVFFTLNDFSAVGSGQLNTDLAWELADSGLEWSVSNGNLYVNRLLDVGADVASFAFQQLDPNTNSVDGFLAFAAGDWDHILTTDVTGTQEDTILKARSGPDGPNGYLVGTAVPEPSSAILFLAGLGAAAVFTLRRRKR